MTQRHRTCATCEWYSQEDSGGYCHYNPGYTETSDDWWCREWQDVAWGGKEGRTFSNVDKEHEQKMVEGLEATLRG